jgi:hypothetical protein
MIIINLTGGLGNQMFQYSFGKTIATKHNTSLKLHFTNALFNTPRVYELNVFNISAILASDSDLRSFDVIQNRVINRLAYLFDERFNIQLNKRIMTQKYPYDYKSDYLLIKDDSYIQGYWQDERFFKEIESIIRKEFTLKNELDDKNKKILKQIQNFNSVSIHVRRTDYITNKNNLTQFIGLDYYMRSIKRINQKISNPVYFVFSDDILWCKENLQKFLKKVYFIDHNKGKDAHKDLILMSACKHNIIANSTFSWWAGWLNQNKNKIIIKPN